MLASEADDAVSSLRCHEIIKCRRPDVVGTYNIRWIVKWWWICSWSY